MLSVSKADKGFTLITSRPHRPLSKHPRRGHRCPGRRIPPPAPPGPAWAGRRYLGAGGWGRAGARGALSARINGGARRGPGRGAAGRGARGAAPRGVLPCGALSTLPERARSSPELRPSQLPANLRAPIRPVPRPSPKLCSNPHTCPPGSKLNPRSASALQAGGSPERAQSALPRRAPAPVLWKRAIPLAWRPADGRGAHSISASARPLAPELAVKALSPVPALNRRKGAGLPKTLLGFKSTNLRAFQVSYCGPAPIKQKDWVSTPAVRKPLRGFGTWLGSPHCALEPETGVS
ncbi:uncharacterized protein LOC117712580 [Arvicanthis niloticus]|uniref:uncharacterized protein LOC117712580 n=1 Tax=Arvicanthis niloticus TaxID=61156 RepID=UPI00402B9D3D